MSQALQTYYKTGASSGWQNNFISKYASSHPWEDWAETWAHYLHIMDMAETACFYGLKVNPSDPSKSMRTKAIADPYTVKDFTSVLQTSIPLSFAVNGINRAMGLPDVYPFVITKGVIKKMKFIHNLLLLER